MLSNCRLYVSQTESFILESKSVAIAHIKVHLNKLSIKNKSIKIYGVQKQ